MSNKIAIIHTNYGPYHIVRVSYFSEIYNGEILPVQLAKSERLRDWRISEEAIQIITLQEKPLEDASQSELSKKLISLLERNKPEVVVIAGYSLPAMRSVAKWARRNKAVSILLSDSHYLDRKRIWLKEKVKGWWIKKRFDSAFVGGVRSQEYLVKLGFPSDRIWRGYDVVDNEYFEKRSEEIRANDSKYRGEFSLPERYFLYVGRFSQEKNLLRLLEAYRIYRDKAGKEAWNLVLVGTGPQENDIKKRCAEYKLNEVLMPGFKQVDELPIYYALASCFILPSVSETWGLSVNEAMASGLPVLVSARCGCVSELVHPGLNGYVFDPFNINEIAYFMKRISLGNLDLKTMGNESRKIISQFTPETWARALKDCIEVTLESKNRL